MMVVPVDADIDKAQHVACDNWNERRQRRKLGAVRWLQFQDHNGDDYGKYAIAEGLEPILVHPAMLSREVAHRNDPRWGVAVPSGCRTTTVSCAYTKHSEYQRSS